MENPRERESAIASETELVRQELARIVTSPGFAAAERLCEFLSFVVDLSLTGQTGHLKETTVGVEVYHRDPTYDPRTEPIVRTEARRLRGKLDEYYEGPGRTDPVRISLPKGGYVAAFEFRPVPAAQVIPIAAPDSVREPEPPPRDFHRPSSTLKWWLTVACVAAGTVLVLALVLRPRTPPPLPQVKPLTSYTGYESEPAVSPDGRQFAFSYNGDHDNFDIYVKFLDAGNPLRLTTDPGHDLHPTWSPDGRYLAFLRVSPDRQQVLVVPALGGSERQVAQISSAEGAWIPDGSAMHHIGPAWSPDGKYLAVSDRPDHDGADAIYLIAADNGARRRLTAPPRDSIGDSMPAFSADGRTLAFVRTASQRGVTDILTIPVAGGSETTVTHDTKTISGLAWWTSGRLLFASNRSGGNLLWSIPAGGGAPEAIAMAGRGVHQVATSSDGAHILYSERVQNSNIWRIDLTQPQSPPQEFLASTGRNDSPQYSPDGKRIVFGSDRSGAYEIWMANGDGANLLQLTNFGGAPVGSPHWSPDGRQIIFDGVRDGRSVLYLMDANGGQPHVFVEEAGDAMMPTWSRDGQFIYFTRRKEGDARSLWKKPANGGTETEVARGQGADAIESADGHSVYYSDKSAGVWQAAQDGAGTRRVNGLEQVRASRYWTVTGRGIYFLRNSQSPFELQFYDFASGKISTIATMTRAPSLGTPSLTVSPDDHWLLYAQMDEVGSDIMILTGLR